MISDYNINQENENWIRLQDLMQHNYQIAFLKATMNSDLDRIIWVSIMTIDSLYNKMDKSNYFVGKVRI